MAGNGDENVESGQARVARIQVGEADNLGEPWTPIVASSRRYDVFSDTLCHAALCGAPHEREALQFAWPHGDQIHGFRRWRMERRRDDGVGGLDPAPSNVTALAARVGA